MRQAALSLSLLICSSQFSSTLHAAENMDNFFSMSLEELMQVEITGSTLTPESLNSVPSAVTVFSHEQIKKMGLDSLDELISLVPGFQSYRISRSSMSISISARGRRVGNASAEILLLIDGQRLNDPRTSGSTPMLKLPLMQIERIEFIRGPAGSAVYGSNAMLGVVNIITRSDASEVGVAVGSYDRKQGYLMTSHKSGDFSVDLFAYFDKDDGDDYTLPNTFGPGQVETDDPRELTNFNLKLKWKKTRLNIQQNQVQAENFYEQNNISNGFNQRKTAISFISLKQDFNWQAVSSFVQVSHTFSRLLTSGQLISATAAAALSGGAGSEPMYASADFVHYNETQLQWHNDWKIKDRNSLQFGVEFRYIDAPGTIADSNYDLGDLANRNFPIRYYAGSTNNTLVQAASTRNIVGVYTQYQQQMFENTQMTMGLRYDHFSEIGGEFSPRLGFVQTLTPHHSVKLLYGEAFRAPTENELNLLNNPVLLGNMKLKPETVQTWDLIWLGQWKYTSFSLGYFENNFKNSIIQEDIGGGTSQFKNADQDPSKGFEFEISHELNKHWLLRGSYTNFTEIPDSSLAEADQFASLMINYQRNMWNANLIATYFDQRTTLVSGNNSVPLALDDYWQVYGKLIYNFTEDLRTYVQLKNLLDENYQTPNASQKLSVGTANRGREVLAGVVWKY